MPAVAVIRNGLTLFRITGCKTCVDYYCYVENFPSYNEALKFEWRWKFISRQVQKKYPKLTPREKRMLALDELLKLDRPTSKAMLYSEWENKPNIVYNQ